MATETFPAACSAAQQGALPLDGLCVQGRRGELPPSGFFAWHILCAFLLGHSGLQCDETILRTGELDCENGIACAKGTHAQNISHGCKACELATATHAGDLGIAKKALASESKAGSHAWVLARNDSCAYSGA